MPQLYRVITLKLEGHTTCILSDFLIIKIYILPQFLLIKIHIEGKTLEASPSSHLPEFSILSQEESRWVRQGQTGNQLIVE